MGKNALRDNLGDKNVAIGESTLDAGSSSSAVESVALGYQALTAATNGKNVAAGAYSLSGVTTGSNNVAIGWNSGSIVEGGQKCIFIGKGANASGANVTDEIAIGADLTGGGSNTARIGQSAVFLEANIADGATPLGPQVLMYELKTT